MTGPKPRKTSHAERLDIRTLTTLIEVAHLKSFEDHKEYSLTIGMLCRGACYSVEFRPRSGMSGDPECPD